MKTTPKRYRSAAVGAIIATRNPMEYEKTKRNMLLAARIDEALKKKGWSKKQLADSMNKNPSEVTKWLSGTHNFTLDTLYLIESYLGLMLFEVSTHELVTV